MGITPEKMQQVVFVISITQQLLPDTAPEVFKKSLF